MVDAKIIVEIHTNSKQFCKFAAQIAINNFMDIKDNIKRYSSPEECKEALRGMLKVKEQWLEYVKRREKELALS